MPVDTLWKFEFINQSYLVIIFQLPPKFCIYKILTGSNFVVWSCRFFLLSSIIFNISMN